MLPNSHLHGCQKDLGFSFIEVHRFHFRMFTQTCLNRRIGGKVDFMKGLFLPCDCEPTFLRPKSVRPLRTAPQAMRIPTPGLRRRGSGVAAWRTFVVQTWQWTTARSTDVYCDTSSLTGHQDRAFQGPGWNTNLFSFQSFKATSFVEPSAVIRYIMTKQGSKGRSNLTGGPSGPSPMSQVITLLWAVLLHHLPSTTAMQDTPTGSTDGLRRQ